MKPIKLLKHDKIQQSLLGGIHSVTQNILIPLGIKGNISRKELLQKVIDNIQSIGFKIEYLDSPFNEDKNQDIPAFGIVKDGYRKNGGIIKLNKSLPLSVQTEGLFHEYIHIKDETLPIHTTDENAINFRAMYDKDYMESTEFQADMAAYTLMMPPEQMRLDLLKVGYDIDEIFKMYNGYEKSTVLQWITLVSPLPCHFAWVMYEKDNNNNIINTIYHDNCYYDHQSDPVLFDIEAVLNNPVSAAAEAKAEQKDVHKASIISGKEYYCYAYYERDQKKQVRKTVSSEKITVSYDRLLAIGWVIDVYKQTQRIRDGYIEFS